VHPQLVQRPASRRFKEDLDTMENISFVHSAQFGFQTPVYCIISDERVHRTKSPRMYNRILQQMGLSGAYVPFMVTADNLGPALESLKVLNISGANISAPYKEKAAQFMDILSEGAQIIGSINTIVCKAGLLKGYNTNAIGFMDALAAMPFEAAGKRALIFGSGGVARAVAFILNWLRAEKVTIVGRDRGRTWDVADRFSGHALLLSDMENRKFSVDIVINTTSVSSPDESPEMSARVSHLALSGCQMILDLNYGRRENFWQQRAQDLELPFQDGLATLAYQARRTFALWTGMDVPAAEFLKALR
jgi:shikimate dehydrogenase